MVLTEFARPKVNLTLNVLGRRPDGYHELASLVVFASGVADKLTLTRGAPVGVRVSGPFAEAIAGENLAAAALRRLAEMEPRLVLGAFDLEKVVPVSAGLGGGSSDAAAVLRLVRTANPDLANGVDWPAVAATLGADVPVCFENRAARVSGIGERVRPLANCPRVPAVLVNPMTEVPAAKTAEVFRRLGAPPLNHDHLESSERQPGEQPADDPSLHSVPGRRGPAAAIRDLARSTLGTSPSTARRRLSALARSGRGRPSREGLPNAPAMPPLQNPAALIDYLRDNGNDLTAPARALLPVIDDVLEELARAPGTLLARLSGAGPTAFGLYASGFTALAAAREVALRRPGWWVQPVWLG
jgi:4-diphosphocytidyl-2C-methyl-D-erythritol kinase